MAYAASGAGAPDHFSCRHGASRLVFRGPPRGLDQPFIAFLGGGETYGKLVETPFPLLVEQRTGIACLNLGLLNAGVDAFVKDPALPGLARRARAVVVQVLGAQNLSNAFYSVHPRRNDRFVAATPRLRSLFPEVELTDIHFTRHLLRRLQEVSPERFAIVAEDLRQVWLRQMGLLLGAFACPRLLLWLGAPLRAECGAHDLRADPLLVDGALLAGLRGQVQGVVQVDLRGCPDSIAYGPLPQGPPVTLPGPLAHDAIARAVTPALEPWL